MYKIGQELRTDGKVQGANSKFETRKLAYLKSYLSLVRLKFSSLKYYYYNDFATALMHVKAAQGRGQNIAWLKNLMTDLCTPNMVMKDVTGTIGTMAGAQFVGGVLLNIWGAQTTIEQGCDYLSAHPTIFN